MIRKGFYCKYKNTVFMCDLDDSTVLLRSHDIEDLEKNGFEKNPYFGKNKFSDLGRYIKEVPLEEVEWFCRIRNQGMYKGRKIAVIGETDTEYIISSGYVSEGEQLFTEENG
ncbi:MAG: hypothetical protein MRZ25_08360, partial [Ruminococcus sp.]|nr:hypothetical protein [Ruminococcus sp.]